MYDIVIDDSDKVNIINKFIENLTKTIVNVDENLRSNLSNWMITRGYLTNVNIAHAYNASHRDDRATIKTKYAKFFECFIKCFFSFPFFKL